MITISIVSHGHAELVSQCLCDIADFPEISEVVLTLNIPEVPPVIPANLVTKLVLIHNSSAVGFGKNHNAAFAQCKTQYFCVLNPDIRFICNPFPQLLNEFSKRTVAAVGPAVLAPNGALEDSIRYFPTPFGLILKAIGGPDGRYHYKLSSSSFSVDWIGGMFMLFLSDSYRSVGGFDDKFYLYYEDVDICARLWKAGNEIVACPAGKVIHDARRASRNNLQHKIWHAKSLIRYLRLHWLHLPD